MLTGNDNRINIYPGELILALKVEARTGIEPV